MAVGDVFDAADHKTIKAYYSGGTLANEAAMLIKDALDLKIPPEKAEGFMLQHDGHVVVDLGDDVYTQGHPHPMIDPAKRIECMEDALDDPTTGVILFDVMLGYGSHADMAGALIPTIQNLQAKAEAAGRKIVFVSTVCGTRRDFQDYDETVKKLKDAGVVVCETNKLACQAAIHAIGLDFSEPDKPTVPRRQSDAKAGTPSDKLTAMLKSKPKVINIGLKSFADVCADFGCETVQFDWAPPAGGDLEMISVLNFLRSYTGGGETVDDMNQKVIAKVVAAQP
ncbi:MAG: acyl-CoA synthetase FdrA, partial [Pseudoramibacter sp.]